MSSDIWSFIVGSFSCMVFWQVWRNHSRMKEPHTSLDPQVADPCPRQSWCEIKNKTKQNNMGNREHIIMVKPLYRSLTQSSFLSSMEIKPVMSIFVLWLTRVPRRPLKANCINEIRWRHFSFREQIEHAIYLLSCGFYLKESLKTVFLVDFVWF